MRMPKRIIFVFLCFSNICFADLSISELSKKGQPTVEQYWENQRVEKEENSKFCPKDLEKGKHSVKMEREKPISKSKIEKQFVGRKIIGGKNIDKTATWEAVSALETTEKISVKKAKSAPIEIIGDITINSNTVWDQDVHIDGRVTVEDSMLWILPGVTVSFAGGANWIKVINNGLIIAEGTPNDCVMFISDEQSYHYDYDFAIKIEASASPKCRVNYCYILFAEKGIWIEGIRLNNPLFGNKIQYCYDGVFQQGPFLTDIINNRIIDCYSDGIEVYMESYDPYTPPTTETHITIEQNTIVGDFYSGWGQDCGIRIHGVQDYNDVGTVLMGNNLIAASYFYALNQVDGYMMEADRYCHGYYGNYAIENPGNPFSDVYPQILEEDPFVYGYTTFPFYLIQDCNLIDTGYVNSSIPDDAPYLLGTTTSIDGIPDSNVADIGFHYSNWNYSNAGDTNLSADFDSSYSVGLDDLLFFLDYWLYDYRENYEIWWWDFDGSEVVDYNDLTVIAEYWLSYFDFYGFSFFARHWQKDVDYRFQDTRPDLNEDGFVDFVDFSIFADQWLEETDNPHPPIEVTISGEPNNLTGEISIGVKGYGLTTEQVFLLMDGKGISKLEYFDSNLPFLLESDIYQNGGHSIKAVAIDSNGLITVSNRFEVDFNNTFYSIMASDYFHPDANYTLLGFHDVNSSFETTLTDKNDQILWSDTYSSGSVSIVIPGAAFGNTQFCELSLTETGSVMKTAAVKYEKANGSGVTKKSLTKKFKQTDCPTNVKMVIVLPNKDVFKARKEAVFECANACDSRNVSWVSLYRYDVTEENLLFLYNKPSVKYVYWCGHGNSHVGRNERLGIEGVRRTHTECWLYEKEGWWDIINNWNKIGVFSWTGQPDAPLPDDWDTRGFNLWSLGMHEEWNKKIVFIDACLSSLSYMDGANDMAQAYGMYSLQGQGSLDQIYIGWRIKVLSAPPGSIFDPILFSTEGVKMFWERMGKGDSVEEALEYTRQYGGIGVRRTLWGLNGLIDLGDEDGDDNIFVRGLGFINLDDIELSY